MEKSIQEMVLETVGGKEDHGEKIVNRLEPLIKKSIGRFYYGEMDYEDLIQEGRLRLLNEIARFDPERNTVFLGVAKKSLQYLYCELRRKRIPLCILNVRVRAEDDTREKVDLIEDATDIEEMCVNRELEGVLKKAFEELCPIHKEIVFDYYLQGMTLRQIATEKKIHYMTAVQRKRRALEELRKSMGKMKYGI
ncbi:MAG TPA: sigma-70 family RNA polymerase sigma factor [Clostridia bacterium]|nr:sigma-70 family RNA polymerase sigma factor [Clostridia bacterium]